MAQLLAASVSPLRVDQVERVGTGLPVHLLDVEVGALLHGRVAGMRERGQHLGMQRRGERQVAVLAGRVAQAQHVHFHRAADRSAWKLASRAAAHWPAAPISSAASASGPAPRSSARRRRRAGIEEKKARKAAWTGGPTGAAQGILP